MFRVGGKMRSFCASSAFTSGRTIVTLSLGVNGYEFGRVIVVNHLLKITSVLSRVPPEHADTEHVDAIRLALVAPVRRVSPTGGLA
jgi:hypothetical protein